MPLTSDEQMIALKAYAEVIKDGVMARPMLEHPIDHMKGGFSLRRLLTGTWGLYYEKGGRWLYGGCQFTNHVTLCILQAAAIEELGKMGWDIGLDVKGDVHLEKTPHFKWEVFGEKSNIHLNLIAALRWGKGEG